MLGSWFQRYERRFKTLDNEIASFHKSVEELSRRLEPAGKHDVGSWCWWEIHAVTRLLLTSNEYISSSKTIFRSFMLVFVVLIRIQNDAKAETDRSRGYKK